MNGGFDFSADSAQFLGAGQRRVCYRLPGTDRCVKFYRAAGDLPPGARLSIRLELAWRRRFRAVNVNVLEWRYHQRLRRRLPADLLAVFPEHTEPVFCRKNGWGIVESLILNADGTPPRAAASEIKTARDAAHGRRVYREVERLLQRFAEHSVCFFDPSNILVQWTGEGAFRLRVADFEPTCRTLVPGLSRLGFYVRRKVHRRAARYLARLRRLLGEPLPE